MAFSDHAICLFLLTHDRAPKLSCSICQPNHPFHHICTFSSGEKRGWSLAARKRYKSQSAVTCWSQPPVRQSAAAACNAHLEEIKLWKTGAYSVSRMEDVSRGLGQRCPQAFTSGRVWIRRQFGGNACNYVRLGNILICYIQKRKGAAKRVEFDQARILCNTSFG